MIWQICNLSNIVYIIIRDYEETELVNSPLWIPLLVINTVVFSDDRVNTQAPKIDTETYSCSGEKLHTLFKV